MRKLSEIHLFSLCFFVVVILRLLSLTNGEKANFAYTKHYSHNTSIERRSRLHIDNNKAFPSEKQRNKKTTTKILVFVAPRFSSHRRCALISSLLSDENVRAVFKVSAELNNMTISAREGGM